MQSLEVSDAVRPIYRSLGVKWYSFSSFKSEQNSLLVLRLGVNVLRVDMSFHNNNNYKIL